MTSGILQRTGICGGGHARPQYCLAASHTRDNCPFHPQEWVSISADTSCGSRIAAKTHEHHQLHFVDRVKRISTAYLFARPLEHDKPELGSTQKSIHEPDLKFISAFLKLTGHFLHPLY
jgi:hypothetical protein